MLDMRSGQDEDTRAEFFTLDARASHGGVNGNPQQLADWLRDPAQVSVLSLESRPQHTNP